MEIEKFKGTYIKILEWRFFNENKEVEEYRDAYSISPKYNLIGKTILGDLLAIKDGNIIQIDHDEPIPENDFKLAKNSKKIITLIEQINKISDYENCQDFKTLKSIRKQIKACKKIAPKNLTHHFENTIDEIDIEIDFFK